MIFLFLFCLLVTACMQPNPMPLYQVGDQTLSCAQLRNEIKINQKQMLEMLPEKVRLGVNSALAVAGTIFIVPWFFMDFNDSDRIEVQALQQRNRWLFQIADAKKCSKMPKAMRFINQTNINNL